MRVDDEENWPFLWTTAHLSGLREVPVVEVQLIQYIALLLIPKL